MTFDGWLDALGSGTRVKQSFRSQELDLEGRTTNPPVLEHVEIVYRGWDGMGRKANTKTAWASTVRAYTRSIMECLREVAMRLRSPNCYVRTWDMKRIS